ncbi:EamA family transporter [Sphaerospermopsis aphanizomenoides BCCUSP55]|uniref:DMT family transporter n=1 Tax=Sphaerospermopsis aphanizomenoides TaxID=459663 RepID=UPI001906625F|nr:EamA family transporter [Sphaerospermopsis aphanizomenoides]MBK1990828.1 EamA family transporter [Sphaerospermopsis aphanizomenoides BCCUSP55]
MTLFLSKIFSCWVTASIRLHNFTRQFTQNNLHLQGIILFIIINIIWGTTFPLIEKTVTSLSPSVLIATRFTVAALFLSVNLRRLNVILWRDGLILGLLFFVYLATETIALESIHANQASFLISLSAIIVPLIGWFLGRCLQLKTFLASGLAVIGIGVMFWGEGILGIGNLLMLVDAFLYAIYTVILEKVASRHPPLSLTSMQLFVIAVMGLIWSNTKLVAEWNIINENWGVILYLGLAATALVIWLQTIAQRWIGSEEAALLYTLEPIFSAIFSFWLLGEQLGVKGLIGAAFVLSAIVLSQQKSPDVEPNTEINAIQPTSPVLVVSEENIKKLTRLGS